MAEQAQRIYVASLSDYNAGTLHGAWIDANQDAAKLHEAVTTMLAASTEPNAEEWAIHDFEGFGPWQVSEWESLEAVAEVAAGIATHGLAYAAWREWTATDAAERFVEDYLGEWPSVVAYAESLTDDCGLTITVEPPSWRTYVDFDHAAFAHDLETELHIAETPDGTVWLFQYR